MVNFHKNYVLLFGVLVLIIIQILIVSSNTLEEIETTDREKFLKDQVVIDFDSLKVIERTASTDLYSSNENEFISLLYSKEVNMKNLDGIYKPYEETTQFNADENEMILEWNDKSVTFRFYTIDPEGIKEMFEDKSLLSKLYHNFKTNIIKKRGGYYFEHTLRGANQFEKIGYEIITENVKCIPGKDSLICDEQRIDFKRAVKHQELNVNISEDSIEISGDDLSYIDPSISIEGDENSAGYGTALRRLSGTYAWDEDELVEIGSDVGPSTDYKARGMATFDIEDSLIPHDATIGTTYLYMYPTNIVMDDCGSYQYIDIYGSTEDDAYEDNIDLSPEDEEEEEDLWLWLDNGEMYNSFIWDSEGDDDQWYNIHITGAEDEIQVALNDSTYDEFILGILGEEDWGDECNTDFYDTSEGSYIHYLSIYYTVPTPTTTHVATSPPGGGSYTSNTWTDENIRHYISCQNDCSYVQYCTGSSCTPSENYGLNEYINISAEGTTYFRWRGVYSGTDTYYESTQQYIDKIDSITPTTTATATSPPGEENYSFNNLTYNNVGVTLSCEDGNGSGCKSGYPKYCIDTLNICSPITNYSSMVNISTFGTSYIRYYSQDIGGNYESTKNKTIEIDNRNYTSNVSMHLNNVNVWNYTRYFRVEETTDNFAQELNDALVNCTPDGEGYCNISLTLHSDSKGKLKLSAVEIYYNLTNNPPNVTLISPLDNNISITKNITLICNVTDEEALSNITLYTNINGTWQANQTKEISGTSNSANFTINNLQDDISFIWNCLAYDDKSQADWANSNWTLNISTPNTVPTVINLTQYPSSLYRGEDIEIRCTVEDDETINSSLDALIEYQNTTNNGYIECENITYDTINGYWKCNYTTNYSDDDLGNFDFRCNVSDSRLSSGWTTDIDTVVVLNNLPIIFSCLDAHIWEDTSGSGVQIDLGLCSSDIEDSDNNLIYQINNQSNPSLIDCYLNSGNLTCNNPSPDEYGYSYIEVQVNDTDGGINISFPSILISVNPYPDDIYRFYHKNSSGDNVSWFGDSGNIVLRGTCNSTPTCSAPSNSLIFANSTDNTTAYIDEEGNMCLENGNCSAHNPTCEPSQDAFIIKNSTGTNMIYIGFDGEICFTGYLYENMYFI